MDPDTSERHTPQPDGVWLHTPAALLLLLSTAWAVLLFVHSYGFIEDDAYIHLEFARSFARGLGFSFNGHVVYGDTAPLWVWLLALVHGAIPNWVVAAKVLGALGLGFAGSGAFVFARELTGSTRFAGWMVLVLVLNPYVAYWSFSGMETVAAAGLAFWMAALAGARQMTWPKFLTAALLAGAAPLLRPEMLFLSAIVASVLLYRWVEMVAPRGRKVAALLPAAVLAAAPAVGWALYAVRTFGRVIPNTNAAKRANPGDSVVLRLLAVYGFGYPVVLLGSVALLGVVAVWVSRRQRHPARGRPALQAVPLGAWIFIAWTGVATAFYIVNHTYVQTRYILPSACGLVVCLLALVFVERPRLLLPMLTLTGVSALLGSVAYAWPNLHNKTVGDRALDSMCTWVEANLPADAPIALYPIGQVAFVAQHPVVDTGGITRPSAIPYLGSDAAMETWLRGEGAMYALAGKQPEPGAVLVYRIDKPYTGWPLDPRTYFRQDDAYRLWKLPAQPTAQRP